MYMYMKSVGVCMLMFICMFASASPSARASLSRYQSLIELAFDQNVSSVQQTAAKTLYKLVRARPSHFAPIYAQR